MILKKSVVTSIEGIKRPSEAQTGWAWAVKTLIQVNDFTKVTEKLVSTPFYFFYYCG